MGAVAPGACFWKPTSSMPRLFFSSTTCVRAAHANCRSWRRFRYSQRKHGFSALLCITLLPVVVHSLGQCSAFCVRLQVGGTHQPKEIERLLRMLTARSVGLFLA